VQAHRLQLLSSKLKRLTTYKLITRDARTPVPLDVLDDHLGSPAMTARVAMEGIRQIAAQ